MKYALIGCGRISTNHIKAALENGLEIVGICDVVPDRMQALLEKHNLLKDTTIERFTDYRRMIAEVKPQLVSIATESGLHGEIALFCIEQGVHVIIEKAGLVSCPMAQSM